MCKAEGLPFDTVQNEITKYNSHAQQQVADEFGKDTFPTTFSPNERISVAYVTPAIHYTMGGLAYNENCQVLSTSGKPIEGLYAAGEVTGGLHGKNRLAGNSLLECVVFGRRAGKKAASIL